MNLIFEDDLSTLYHGDCTNIRAVTTVIPRNSVHLIITDPPYAREFLSITSSLGELARETLVNGGFLYSYYGSEYLPEAILRLSKWLNWFWLYNIRHNGGFPRMNFKRLLVSSKPVLVFTNGAPDPHRLSWDQIDFLSDRREKGLHPWQQGSSFPKHVIELRTAPGEIVLDPFCGSGTFLLAARQLGRRSIGIDNSIDYITTAAIRLKYGIS